ncbi:HNH endonuclease [Vibrio alginolyticus]
MRKIDRNTVQVPHKLAQLYTDVQTFQAAKNAIAQGRDIRKGLYRHRSVEIALEGLYKNVCFLCQKEIIGDYDIEHFLPWSNLYPERAYDWNNLHQSCKACNQRKKRKEYKDLDSTDDSKVVDILLLDPSVNDVEDLITFDPDTCEVLPTDVTNLKANQTSQFLNDLACKHARMTHLKKLTNVLISEQWFNTFSLLKGGYSNFQNRVLDFNDERDSKVGQLCYNIVSGYLAVNKAYNMFVLRTFQQNTGITVRSVVAYARQHCDYNAIRLPAMVC